MSTSPHLSPYLWLAIAAGITGCGMGLSVPASNNASLQLAPDQVAAIAGLRGMFRQSGAIIAVSVTTAILARSTDAGIAQAHVFLVFAALLVAMLAAGVPRPDHKRRLVTRYFAASSASSCRASSAWCGRHSTS